MMHSSRNVDATCLALGVRALDGNSGNTRGSDVDRNAPTQEVQFKHNNSRGSTQYASLEVGVISHPSSPVVPTCLQGCEHAPS